MIIHKFLNKINLIPNGSILPKYLSYATSDNYWFNFELELLEKQKYNITSFGVDKDGNFKLVAKLKPALLTRCVLKEKEINEAEDFYLNCKYRHLYNSPIHCKYYNKEKGLCTCGNRNSCIYQKTKKHEAILKKMVNIYKKKSKKNQEYLHSYFYDNTEYGRVFNKNNYDLNEMKFYDRLN